MKRIRGQSPLLLLLIIIVATLVTILAATWTHGGSLASETAIHAPVSQTTSTHEAQETVTTTTSRDELKDVFIVELGDPRCPHCRAMKEFFRSYVSETNVAAYFCSVENQVCAEAFWALYKLKATMGVPTIIACSKNGVLFVEVGELKDANWWTSALTSHKPTMNGDIPVYIAGEKYREIHITKELYQLFCTASINASKVITSP